MCYYPNFFPLPWISSRAIRGPYPGHGTLYTCNCKDSPLLDIDQSVLPYPRRSNSQPLFLDLSKCKRQATENRNSSILKDTVACRSTLVPRICIFCKRGKSPNIASETDALLQNCRLSCTYAMPLKKFQRYETMEKRRHTTTKR